MITYLTDRITFDGWRVLRREDIQSVTNWGSRSFADKALKARGMWPPTTPDSVRIGSIREVLQMAGADSRLVAISCDFYRPDVSWIGAVEKIGKNTLTMLEVTTNARWYRESTRFDLADITEIGFGGGYEDALQAVAGDKPSR